MCVPAKVFSSVRLFCHLIMITSHRRINKPEIDERVIQFGRRLIMHTQRNAAVHDSETGHRTTERALCVLQGRSRNDHQVPSIAARRGALPSSTDCLLRLRLCAFENDLFFTRRAITDKSIGAWPIVFALLYPLTASSSLKRFAGFKSSRAKDSPA